MRLASWNIENLAPWLGPGSLRDLRGRVVALGEPDVLVLQEVKLRPGDRELVAQMHEALPGYTCHAALADDPKNVTYRGGRAYGVATYTRDGLGKIAAQAPAWDREGRVLVTVVAGLAIVNLYAVNGTTKPYFDPDTGEEHGTRHTHKRFVQDQVFALAEQLREFGGVIVAGDWNVSRTVLDVHPRLRSQEPHATHRAELNAHLERTGFVDAYRHLHPEAKAYSWYAKKYALDAARVDYIVVSPDLVPRLRAATVEPRPARASGSDHAAIAIELA
ncbi:MAG: exodeoxyribonuclease III [Kofleriaceae bacterium]